MRRRERRSTARANQCSELGAWLHLALLGVEGESEALRAVVATTPFKEARYGTTTERGGPTGRTRRSRVPGGLLDTPTLNERMEKSKLDTVGELTADPTTRCRDQELDTPQKSSRMQVQSARTRGPTSRYQQTESTPPRSVFRSRHMPPGGKVTGRKSDVATPVARYR